MGKFLSLQLACGKIHKSPGYACAAVFWTVLEIAFFFFFLKKIVLCFENFESMVKFKTHTHTQVCVSEFHYLSHDSRI
jgi:hypothetical protein